MFPLWCYKLVSSNINVLVDVLYTLILDVSLAEKLQIGASQMIPRACGARRKKRMRLVPASSRHQSHPFLKVGSLASRLESKRTLPGCDYRICVPDCIILERTTARKDDAMREPSATDHHEHDDHDHDHD